MVNKVHGMRATENKRFYAVEYQGQRNAAQFVPPEFLGSATVPRFHVGE
jgi:hypothetical protein